METRADEVGFCGSERACGAMVGVLRDGSITPLRHRNQELLDFPGPSKGVGPCGEDHRQSSNTGRGVQINTGPSSGSGGKNGAGGSHARGGSSCGPSTMRTRSIWPQCLQTFASMRRLLLPHSRSHQGAGTCRKIRQRNLTRRSPPSAARPPPRARPPWRRLRPAGLPACSLGHRSTSAPWPCGACSLCRRRSRDRPQRP